jgi:mannose-1-phosphate guanylyltransferase
VEPCGRGTAPCIGLAALHLRRRDPAAVMAVLSADHCVEHADRLCDALSFGDELAQRGQLVTLGVQPSSPMTGYGYIHQGELVAKRAGLMAHQVAAFEEKPNLQRARDYLASGDYVWNAGIFVWRADRILEELALHSPLVASILMALDKVIGSSVEHSVLHTIWPTIENIAIDIAVMERTAHAVVIPTALGWSDVGDWDAFADTLAPDANGNAVVGTHIGRNTHHSLIYGNKRVVATIGVDDLLIVDTPDVLLVCSRANAQEVKALVAQIREHDSRLL